MVFSLCVASLLFGFLCAAENAVAYQPRMKPMPPVLPLSLMSVGGSYSMYKVDGKWWLSIVKDGTASQHRYESQELLEEDLKGTAGTNAVESYQGGWCDEGGRNSQCAEMEAGNTRGRHGQGTLTIRNELEFSTYEGQWSQGARYGRGEVTVRDRSTETVTDRYTGAWSALGTFVRD